MLEQDYSRGPARWELLQEVSEFLFAEADLLDERRYDEWLDLLADDYQYSVPLRLNVEYSEVDERSETKAGSEVCWFDEPKSTIELRVLQLATGVHWAEEPVSRVSHLVTNIRIEDLTWPEVKLSSRFLVYRNRVADETDFFVGRRKDTLRKTDDGWKVARRFLLLDQTVLLAKNLSVFL
ncbi:3-phenylpropionate/cinnamic acid dioxygenase subunit beta [Microbacterium sp. SYP-A9085]|uniref:3-phenylpropionate/cinnamic acid dioxygenase subunit beta n=1 Tax=Microbacterium sp. SYP-A9085 TaxID=2664454 RepID=UPI00129BF392|nr:3-phenylpropionate/cinnamic acid dioxygenase subunit beta [Microbacterium sp. SYP-A9085]MRH28010.1 3-phenylpropionate/cinnamic acid dioxygenase subunit beta [Microbacterium sp. SYP-A9085]